MLSKRSLGRLEQRKAGFHHAADKAYYLILAVLVIALHDDMHHSIWQMGMHHLKICFTGIGQFFPPVGNTVILGQGNHPHKDSCVCILQNQDSTHRLILIDHIVDGFDQSRHIKRIDIAKGFLKCVEPRPIRCLPRKRRLFF